jgi:CheY-like chemotaxis protein
VIGVARTGRGVRSGEESRPDVILMDINMPDMDRITATETIRRSCAFRSNHHPFGAERSS